MVLAIAGGPVIPASQVIGAVAAKVEKLGGTDPDGMRHLAAIERVGCRGVSYANEDFDVLASAWRWANAPAMPWTVTVSGPGRGLGAGEVRRYQYPTRAAADMAARELGRDYAGASVKVVEGEYVPRW